MSRWPGRIVLVLWLASSVAAGAQVPSPEGSAWTLLEAGRLQEAAAQFEAALAKSPRDPQLHFGAGVAAFQMGKLRDAKTSLQEALHLDPQLSLAALLLGQLLARDGDLPGAIRLYEDVLTRAPDEPLITERLDRWRAEQALHEQFRQTLSPNFTVLFEGPNEEAIAAKAIEVLEAAFWHFGETMGVYPTEVVTVVLYTAQQFQDITRAPSWSAGAFDGRIRVPVQGALKNEREFARVLTHEFTHAAIYSIAPRGVPQWLNEGLATLAEQDDLSAFTDVSEQARRVPLDKLSGSFRALPESYARLAYAVSTLATRTLLDLAGASAVVSLLQDLGTGVPFDDAFARRMPITFAEFQKSWAAGTQ